jgi:hypothetical protein
MVSYLVLAPGPARADQKPAPPKAPMLDLSQVRMIVNDNRFYLDRLIQTRQALDRAKNDRGTRELLLQMVGFHYAYVGRYQKAMEVFDRRGNTAAAIPSGPLSAYEPQDAVETIVDLAGRHQVVFINEAMHVPMHRAFTLQLLERLHRRGFRYFAAEALTARDDGLAVRGYPTLQSGSHLAEPVYADLVRTALHLGYEVVPYEYELAAPPDPDANPLTLQAERGDGQAKNLRDRILAKDPKAKILVHAGYGHTARGEQTFQAGKKRGKVQFMAAAFEALTHIRPLSIDQTFMSEHSRPNLEMQDFHLALSRGLVVDRPVVLRSRRTGDFYVPGWLRPAYDLMVFHPRTRYQHGRPTWLALGGRRKPYAVRTTLRPAMGSSYLVQAFAAKEEGSEAVPVDQVEYGPDELQPTLWLPKGDLRIRIVDGSGKVLQEYARKGS